jgi:hypothetical protein
MAYFMPEYSVWNPATSSDSASGMSKGNRFVSAKAEITNRMNARESGSANQTSSCCCCQTTSVRVTFPASMRIGTMDRPRATS